MGNVNGNKLMLKISAFMVLLMGVIYVAHHHLGLLSTYAFLLGANDLSFGMSTLLYIFLTIPIALLTLSFIVYKKQKESKILPLILTLTFTFTSIAMIAAGNGFVEYHFSIFMMLALISSAESLTNVSSKLRTESVELENLVRIINEYEKEV